MVEKNIKYICEYSEFFVCFIDSNCYEENKRWDQKYLMQLFAEHQGVDSMEGHARGTHEDCI